LNEKAALSMTGPKVQVFQQFAEVARTLAHATRVELLEHVGQGERSVERLAQLINQSIANTSQHLQQLRRSALCQTPP
jgi:DNA-binding transcriptional ArsR family regulator